MAGYVRQSAADIVPTAVVRAAPINNEFNALRDAFDAASGHKHDGTTGEGAFIEAIGDTAGYTRIAIDSNNNRIGLFINVSNASVEQVRIQDGAIVPVTDNDIDLGASGAEFKDLYIDGTANIDSLVADTADINGGTVDNTIIGGGTAAAGTFTTVTATTGNITTVNATTVDTTNIEVTNIKAKDGTASASIADSTGVITVASSVLTTTDINGGTIDGTAVGASTPSTGAFTTLSSNSTTTLNGTTIPASKTLVVTTDIGVSVQAYDAQLADVAGLTPTDGNFIVGDGSNFITESGATARTSLGLGSIATQAADNVNLDGGAIDGTTIGAGTPSTGAFTTLSSNSTTTLNGTTIPASKTLLVSTDIGSTVQGYDADTAKYDDTTANFTGTLQNGGSNVLVDTDIGSTVQAYDAQLADVAGLTPTDGNFIVGDGTNFITESGSTARASLGLGTIATQAANNVDIDGGAIDGVTLGTNSAVTEAQIDNVNINGNSIVSTDTDGDLNLTPNGTGDLVLDGLKWPQADGTADYVLKTDGAGQLSWTAQSGGGAGTVTSVDVSGGTTGLTTSGGPITSSGTITIAGTLSVANGGTGATTLTSNNVILGNGTSAVQFVAPGTSGNILTSNGTTWTSAAPAAGGIDFVVKTANYTTQNNEGVLADTSGGAFTVTLPATPSTGDQVVVADSGSNWGTNNLTIGRNGSTIEGASEDLVCDIDDVSVQLIYDGTTWQVYSQAGGAGGAAGISTGKAIAMAIVFG